MQKTVWSDECKLLSEYDESVSITPHKVSVYRDLDGLALCLRLNISIHSGKTKAARHKAAMAVETLLDGQVD